MKHWDCESQSYIEEEDEYLTAMDVGSDTPEVESVGGGSFFGKRKKKVKKLFPQQGTPLLPKGGQSGRKSGNFYSTLYKRGEPESGYYGGADIPKKGASINGRVRSARTSVGTDARGRNPGMRGSNFG